MKSLLRVPRLAIMATRGVLNRANACGKPLLSPLLISIISILLITANTHAALAACANPAGIAGKMIYNSTSHVAQYCNGTGWIAMGKSPGSGGGGCANPSGPEGRLIYNVTSHVMQYCDGANWVATGPPGSGGGGGAGMVIDGGGDHTCGVQSGGALWCWGYDFYGQLGDDASIADKATPVIVAGGATWKAVAAGYEHTCGIKSDDTLWCWGNDTLGGQLGDDATIADQATPVIVAGGATWKALSTGQSHTCGIKSDDTLWCWGSDSNGQLGDDATIADKATPVIVAGGATWKVVSAGGRHTCGIKSDDTLWCWGYDFSGQLGDDATPADQPTPVIVAGGSTWKALNAGNDHTCGIKSDNTLWCWGTDNSGRLGDGGFSDQYTPVVVAGGATWKAVAAGYHTCGIKSDNTLWCWGDGTYGQRGDGSTTPTQATPVQESSASTWTAVTAGNNHTCGIKSDNTLWCWGSDVRGALGNDALLANQPTPVAVAIADALTQTIKGIASSAKPQASPWTPMTSVSLSGGDTLLVCIATLGTVTGVTWNTTALNLDASNTAGAARVYIYSLPNVTSGTGNIVVSTSASTTSAITATAISGVSAAPFDKQSTGNGSSATPSSGATATTSQAQEFLYGCAATNGPRGDLVGVWDNSFSGGQRWGTTGGLATTNATASDGYFYAHATGTYTAGKSSITSRAWGAAIATYTVNNGYVPCGCTWPTGTGGCTNPSGVEGRFMYNSTSNVMQFCNGSNWIRTGW